MSTGETPHASPLEMPSDAPLSGPPTLRPRPAGHQRRDPTRRPDVDAVVDCAVYVDGRRQEPVGPEDALEMARERGGFVWLGLYAPTEDELGAIAERERDNSARDERRRDDT